MDEYFATNAAYTYRYVANVEQGKPRLIAMCNLNGNDTGCPSANDKVGHWTTNPEAPQGELYARDLPKVDGEVIWDSMAIAVWAAERYPEARLWPSDAHARWLARSAACEMHGGFTALRTACSTGPDHWMVGPSRAPAPDHPGLAKDLRRIVELWRSLRERFGVGGPYLFGDWSVPDAFFTPVAARIRHFQLDLAAHGDDGTAQAYAETLLAHPHFREWEADALDLMHDNHPG